MTKNTLVYSLMGVLRDHLPKGHESPLARLNELAVEGVRARLLEEAGVGVVRSEMFRWEYEFDDFEGPWALLDCMGMTSGQGQLPPEAREAYQAPVGRGADRLPAALRRIPHPSRVPPLLGPALTGEAAFRPSSRREPPTARPRRGALR